MTDNEIIQALEEILTLILYEGDLQRASTISRAIDLINRQQKAIEKLEKVEYFADKTIAAQQAEIEKLTINMNAFGLGMRREAERARSARPEAIKEFAEKLKRKSRKMQSSDFSGDFWDRAVLVEDINNLVKEMIGEE